MRLAGVTAIITGGASGLGEATARALAAGGARVAVFDLDQAGAEAIAGPMGGAGFACDITDEAAVQQALARVRQSLGVSRIIVNCAGIGGGGFRTAGPKGPHPLDLFRRLMDVHLTGAFNIARLGAQAMLEAPLRSDGERGVIIHTSSIAATDGPVGMVAYSAAKAGVIGLTLPMARDLAPAGIRVCTIIAGNFETPMLAGVRDALRSTLLAMQPFPNRFGRPEEFARLACHICENSMLNGVAIRLDGGLRLNVT